MDPRHTWQIMQKNKYTKKVENDHTKVSLISFQNQRILESDCLQGKPDHTQLIVELVLNAYLPLMIIST